MNKSDIVIHNCRFAAFFSLIFSGLFCAGGCWVLSWANPEHLPSFLLGLALAGGGFLASVYNLVRLFDPNPKLILTETGLIDHRRGKTLIYWDWITAARLSQTTRNGSVESAWISLTVSVAGIQRQWEINVCDLAWNPDAIFQEIGRRARLA